MRRKDDTIKAVADATIRDLLRTGEMKTLWDKWFQNPIPPKNVKLGMPPPETLEKLWTAPNDLPMEAFAAK
jgi:glutamate/aspartate transport system substrate-binding protein